MGRSDMAVVRSLRDRRQAKQSLCSMLRVHEDLGLTKDIRHIDATDVRRYRPAKYGATAQVVALKPISAQAQR